jgi:hypothetical protein
MDHGHKTECKVVSLKIGVLFQINEDTGTKSNIA